MYNSDLIITEKLLKQKGKFDYFFFILVFFLVYLGVFFFRQDHPMTFRSSCICSCFFSLYLFGATILKLPLTKITSLAPRDKIQPKSPKWLTKRRVNYALCAKGPTPPWCVGGVLEQQEMMTEKMIGRWDKVTIPTGQKNAENGSVKCMYTLELIHNLQLHAGQTLSHLCSVSAKNKKKKKKILWFFRRLRFDPSVLQLDLYADKQTNTRRPLTAGWLFLWTCEETSESSLSAVCETQGGPEGRILLD